MGSSSFLPFPEGDLKMSSLKELEKFIKVRDSGKLKPKKPKKKPFASRALPRHELLASLNWSRPLLRVAVSLLNTRTADIADQLNRVTSEGEPQPKHTPAYIQ